MGNKQSDTTHQMFLRYQNKTYVFDKTIGEGANGVVCTFSVPDDETKDTVVVKLMDVPAQADQRQKLQIVCNKCCVRSTLLHNGQVEVIDRMDGDLLGYIRETADITLKKIAGILSVVRNQLECIDLSCGVYTDIKCENVLYRHSNGLLEVHLGDIDSIVQKSKLNPPKTYPLPCIWNQSDEKSRCEEPAMVDHLTTILYMDMMLVYYEHRNEKKANDYNRLLNKNINCKTPDAWKKVTEEIERMDEYNIVYRSIDKQTKPKDDICRHCLQMTNEYPNIVECLKSSRYKKCTVTAPIKDNYIFYKHTRNKLKSMTKNKNDTMYSLRFETIKKVIQVG